MFANECQQARVCEALCRAVRLEGMWTDEGPTDVAVSLLKRNGGPLSSGERIMFLAAWNVWNGRGEVNLGDAVHRLDQGCLRALGSLLIALGTEPSGVSEWLQKMGPTASVVPSPSGPANPGRNSAKAGR
jgi:hypothetical protein